MNDPITNIVRDRIQIAPLILSELINSNYILLPLTKEFGDLYSTEAINQRWYSEGKKMFLTISHNLQENSCARASFSLLKRDSGTDIFCEFCDFFKNNFSQNISKRDPEGRIM